MKNVILINSAILGIILVLSAYAGYIQAENSPEKARDLFEKLRNEFEPLLNLPVYLIPLAIFANNTIKSFFLILSGVIVGVIPFLFIGYNGYIIGLIINIAGQERGIGNVILSLLPHGILEIPAVLLSGGLGIWIGAGVLKTLAGNKEDVRSRVGYSLRIFLRVVVPMLFVAAIIETFISPYISSL